jgi:hypothetical protein
MNGILVRKGQGQDSHQAFLTVRANCAGDCEQKGGRVMAEIPFTDCLNVRQAFDAFRAFLEADYAIAPSEDVLHLIMMTDPVGIGTSDPAMWYDWLAAVSSVMLPRTPEVEHLIAETAGNERYLMGGDSGRSQWYAQTLADGSQFWVYMYDSTVRAAGHHRVPHMFDGELIHPENP